MLQINTIAPDFEASLSDGGHFKLSDFKDRFNVILYFYPKDFTSGCTVEARTFRDRSDELALLQTKVFGVSFDSLESHQRFAKSCGISFPLIADTEKKIARLYDAVWFSGLAAKRITYVIDRDGVIRGALHYEARIKNHIENAIKITRSLQH
ncbi:MAG: peroxiredoxin [Bacteroidota bacterium]|nr:peroxiredoxin [Bacteroidota bacterium]